MNILRIPANLALLTALFLYIGDRATAQTAPSITSAQVSAYVGQYVDVTATVTRVSTNTNGRLLFEIDGTFPNQALTVAVLPKYAGLFGDASRFIGHAVVIHGTILKGDAGNIKVHIASPKQIEITQ